MIVLVSISKTKKLLCLCSGIDRESSNTRYLTTPCLCSFLKNATVQYQHYIAELHD